MSTGSFTCPRCGMTSHNPDDVREGYCGNCHDWTRDLRVPMPPPLGMTDDNVRVIQGALDRRFPRGSEEEA